MYKEDWDKSKYVDPEKEMEDHYERLENAADARLSTLDEYQRYMESIKPKIELKPRSVDSSWIGSNYVALPKKESEADDSTKKNTNTKKTAKKQPKKVDLLRPQVEEKKEKEQVAVKDFSQSRANQMQGQTPNQNNVANHIAQQDIRPRMTPDLWTEVENLVQGDANSAQITATLAAHKLGGYFINFRGNPEYFDDKHLALKLCFKCIAWDAYTTFLAIYYTGIVPGYMWSYGANRYRGTSLMSEAIAQYRAGRNNRFVKFLYTEGLSLTSSAITAGVEMADFDLFCAVCSRPDDFKYLMRGIKMEDIYHLDLIHWLISLGLIKYIEKLWVSLPSMDLDAATWCYGDSNEQRSHETPLMVAARYGHMNIVKFLVEKGADVSMRDIWGKQASEIATNPEIKKYLKKLEDAHIAKFARVSSYSNMAESVDIRTKAIKRIMRDMKEVWESPLPTVWAYPLEYDIFQWHVVLSPPPRNNATEQAFYPFHGLKLHLILHFPDDYPRNPPKVKLSTSFPHPNVYGQYICMDMLQQPFYSSRVDEETGNRIKYGNTWSSGYSANSVLLQLQAFLYDERVPQWGNRDVVNKINFMDRMYTYRDAMYFKCSECGYNIDYKGVDLAAADRDSLLVPPPRDYVSPDYPQTKTSLAKVADQLEKLQALIPYTRNKQIDKRYKGECVITNLPDSAVLEIFDYLPEMEDLSALMRTCRLFASVSHRYSVWTRRELVCFFSKRTWKEDILGIGLYVERHKSNKKLKTINSPLHLISRTAFLEDEVRTSAWLEPFHYWLPIVINQRHAQFALPLIKSIFVAMIQNVSFEPKQRITDKERRNGPSMAELMEFDAKMLTLRDQFEPLMVLDILPRLMNHMVVALMKTNDSGGILPLHDSEMALLGYCTYHHILLNLVNEFPVIQEKVDFFFKEFMSQPQRRVKKVIPDLGEMLVHLSIASNATWESIAEVFLQEFFDRTVVWMLDQKHGNHGELAYLETDKVSQYRLDVTLQTTRTSTRLLMFQVFFLRMVGSPGKLTLPQILKRYNDLYGRPQPGVPVMLQKECRKIHAVKTWQEFYDRIGLPYPGDEQMTHTLREAVRNSEKKGYHINRYSERELLEWRGRCDLLMRSYYDSYYPTLNDAPTYKKPVFEDTTAAPAPVATPTNEEGGLTAVDRKKWNSIPLANKIVVRNLAWKSTDDDVKWIFKQFGEPSFAKIMRDETGKSRGFAFVAFPDESTVNVVLDYMQGCYLWSRELELSKFGEKPKPRTQPTQPPKQDLFANLPQEEPVPKKPVADKDGFVQSGKRGGSKPSNNNNNNNYTAPAKGSASIKPPGFVSKPLAKPSVASTNKAPVPPTTTARQPEAPKKSKGKKKGPNNAFSVLNVE